MHIEAFRDYCLSKLGAEETFPFGVDTLVYKVGGKMFALTSFSNPTQCNLKCDPERAITLRSEYNAVIPGYHMSKTHWNTILYNQDFPDQAIFECIDESYDLVVASLPAKLRNAIQ